LAYFIVILVYFPVLVCCTKKYLATLALGGSFQIKKKPFISERFIVFETSCSRKQGYA
jgi:hypothetical protein